MTTSISNDNHADAPTRIPGIGGSTRVGSNTLGILQTVLGLAEEAGAETPLLSVRDLNLPVYDPDVPFESQPRSVHVLIDEIQQADAFILASPTYHGTVSGALKNALDAIDSGGALDRVYLDQRPVGLIAYGGPSALNVINAFYHSVRGLRGMQVPTVLAVNNAVMNSQFTAITEPSTLHRAEAMIAELIAFARMRRNADCVDAVGV